MSNGTWRWPGAAAVRPPMLCAPNGVEMHVARARLGWCGGCSKLWWSGKRGWGLWRRLLFFNKISPNSGGYRYFSLFFCLSFWLSRALGGGGVWGSSTTSTLLESENSKSALSQSSFGGVPSAASHLYSTPSAAAAMVVGEEKEEERSPVLTFSPSYHHLSPPILISLSEAQRP